MKSPAVANGSPWWAPNPPPSSARPAAHVQYTDISKVFQHHPPPHISPFRTFWLEAHLPHVTPMTCLICVPKLPWSRTKLYKSPLFKQILSRCVILMHFSSLPLHTISLCPPSPPAPSLFPVPSRIVYAVRSENAAAAHLLKYLYFSFLLYRLTQLCFLTQY